MNNTKEYLVMYEAVVTIPTYYATDSIEHYGYTSSHVLRVEFESDADMENSVFDLEDFFLGRSNTVKLVGTEILRGHNWRPNLPDLT
jgi:hypothetical protein